MDLSVKYQHLKVERENGVCQVVLSRSDVHNAFNKQLISELHRAFEQISATPGGLIRVAVLSGEGRSFCAGADVNWMRESLYYSEEENLGDARSMAQMFDTINSCPVPVIGRVHGAALGGGVGLAAVCDIVVQAEGTRWAFSEVKLGIAPAVISPYVLAKIGRSHARSLFLTGERFSAERALQIGLAHWLVPEAQLDSEVARITQEILSCAPMAVTRAKELILAVPDLEREEAMLLTTQTIASLRVSPEGQEGLRAFLEKRKPAWAL